MRGGAINARLFSAARLVRQDAIFADIGTDHAYLPLFLLSEGRIGYAYCTDINEGPLESAKKNAAEKRALDKTEFLLTDGAAALAGRGITDYAICGMGGELIADIIARAEHLANPEISLILQPMSKQAHLRRALALMGYEIKTESYSCDAGKYYVCLLVRYTGKRREIDDAEAELGAKNVEIVNKDCQIGYLKTKLSSLERARRGKAMGGESVDSEELAIAAIEEYLKTN